MSGRGTSEGAARRRSADRGVAAIAIGLAFVVFVIMRGLTRPAAATWLVASAAGIAVFAVVRAARRRRDESRAD